MESQTAEVLWWIASAFGLFWWPGQFYALWKKKTSFEHSILAWMIGSIGNTVALVAGYLFESPALFWTMLMYEILHLAMLAMVIWYRIRPQDETTKTVS